MGKKTPGEPAHGTSPGNGLPRIRSPLAGSPGGVPLVSLLVAETTGALAASFMTILRLLARQTRLPGATDNTRYGEGRASPRSFLTHHVANISTAIQTADAQTILNAASARMLRVSFGVM